MTIKTVSRRAKTIKFPEIETALHNQIKEDARNRARTLLSKFTGHLVTGPVLDEDLAAAVKEYDTSSNTALIRQEYDNHLKYGNIVNETGHSLAHFCGKSYQPYDARQDRNFFNM